MSKKLNIQYLPQQYIDKQKWDNCIDTADNGLVYGYSFYLDHMAKHWEALVLNDYEAVMPLTWNRKYGIHYLYQPFLAAQLGIFGKKITADITHSFLRSVPAKFKYWDIYLNRGNVFPATGFDIYERSNYILPLNKSYEELSSNYRDNIRRNSRKAKQSGCISKKDFEAEAVIQLAVQQMRQHNKESDDNVNRFRGLYRHLHAKQMATTYGIFSEKDELLASCIFFFSHNRAYYILVGNHPNGKTLGASHALIDAFIADHADSNMILDFEGSDIRNLAFFYSSFGAVEEKFAGLKLNKLPFYLRFLKK